MAIFVGGMECPLCGEIIESGDIVSMPAGLVMNMSDPLWELNDAAFHRACFIKHPHSERATKLIAEAEEARKEWPPFCTICGARITVPDEYFGFGALTDDPTNPLTRYRLKHAHKSCLDDLDDLTEIYDAVRLKSERAYWTGPAVAYLMSELGQAIQRKSAVTNGTR